MPLWLRTCRLAPAGAGYALDTHWTVKRATAAKPARYYRYRCTEQSDGEKIMARIDATHPPARDSRLERELEREHNEHVMNHNAKTEEGLDADERNKDARQTTFSATVRRKS